MFLIVKMLVDYDKKIKKIDEESYYEYTTLGKAFYDFVFLSHDEKTDVSNQLKLEQERRNSE